MSDSQDLKHINDIIAERFRSIEANILSAETIADLFECLLEGVEKEFGVPFVWISLMNTETALPVIDDVRTSGYLSDRYSVVSPDLFEKILAGGMKPVLTNKDLVPFYRLLPHSRKYFVKSVAVVPFALNGQIIGTWNNGDADENRYEADMKTDLIEKLAGQISAKLSELVDRKKVKHDQAEAEQHPGGSHD